MSKEKDLDVILEKDKRYQKEAYEFVKNALNFTCASLKKDNVTGQELLKGIRKYALKLYGPMAKIVLNEWGVNCCEDFGNIVFNLVNNRLLKKTEEDSIKDFSGGYDFEEAFDKPFKMQ